MTNPTTTTEIATPFTDRYNVHELRFENKSFRISSRNPRDTNFYNFEPRDEDRPRLAMGVLGNFNGQLTLHPSVLRDLEALDPDSLTALAFFALTRLEATVDPLKAQSIDPLAIEMFYAFHGAMPSGVMPETWGRVDQIDSLLVGSEGLRACAMRWRRVARLNELQKLQESH